MTEKINLKPINLPNADTIKANIKSALPAHEVKTVLVNEREIDITLEHGIKNGPMTIKKNDGKPEILFHFDQDVLQGEAIMYHENGVVSRRMNFAKGKIDGLLKSFHPNGQPAMEVQYKMGKIHGISKNFNQNGEITIQAQYKDGLQDGEMIIYSHGKPHITKYFKQGVEVHKK